MKLSRKILVIILSVCLVVGTLTGCASNGMPSESEQVTPESNATETANEEDSSQQTEPADEEDAVAAFKLFDENGDIIRTGRSDEGEKGMVSSGKVESSQIGRSILEKGGNAVDAAVAVGFALGVCEPAASGLGGGGFMTLRMADKNETYFIDFREIAPSNASPEMWPLDEEGHVIDGVNKKGGKSVGVPGQVAGMAYVLENYGTMSLEEVMQPAIELAENGYVVSPTLAGDISYSFDKLIEFPATGDIYLNADGFPYETGDVIKNPDLAETMRKIVKGGKDAFYTGEVAQAIVDAVQADNGVLTLEDMANYEVKVRKPSVGNYRGYEIISSPPPSSGGTVVIEILNVLENFDIASMEVNSPEYMHLWTEVLKMCYADRAQYMADTDFVDVPLTGMTSKEYAKKLAEKIDMNTPQVFTYDDPWMFEHEDTTHYSIGDEDGNLVSVTQTINYYFGSGITAEGTGVVMNNEMGDFSPGTEGVNIVEPGKKPLSSMSPTIVLKDGEPVAVLGSPGGSTIITAVAEVISKIVDHDMDIQDAIDSPRFVLSGGKKIKYSGRIDQSVIDKLVEMGHEVEKTDDWYRGAGSVNAVLYNEDGTISGGADPRRDGKALGY